MEKLFNSKIKNVIRDTLKIDEALSAQEKKFTFNSDFLNNFQVLGFGDLGTAWSGLSPFMDSNSLNQQILPIGGDARTGEVVLKTNKEPVIGGFGIGLRTTIIGYFIRADWAWGVEDGLIQRNLFYLSLTTDF